MISIADLNGNVLATMDLQDKDMAFQSACLSSCGKYIYAAANNNYVYCFSLKTREIQHGF